MAVVPLRRVAELVRDGDVVALEGFTHLIPHAAGHELIRQGRRDLTLIRMTPDVVYDQLIGMGCARKLVFSWGGNPGVGSLHRLRDAVENGWPRPLELEEHSHAGMAAAYAAGAANLPFGSAARLRGGDLPARTRVATIDVPVHRRRARRRAGAPAGRRDRPRAAGRPARATCSCGASSACRRRSCSPRRASIVTVEEIVDELEPRPGAIVLPAWVVDAVALAPGGAHPSYAHGYYERDNDFYVAWDEISRDSRSVALHGSLDCQRHVLRGSPRRAPLRRRAAR